MACPLSLYVHVWPAIFISIICTVVHCGARALIERGHKAYHTYHVYHDHDDHEVCWRSFQTRPLGQGWDRDQGPHCQGELLPSMVPLSILMISIIVRMTRLGSAPVRPPLPTLSACCALHVLKLKACGLRCMHVITVDVQMISESCFSVLIRPAFCDLAGGGLTGQHMCIHTIYVCFLYGNSHLQVMTLVEEKQLHKLILEDSTYIPNYM